MMEIFKVGTIVKWRKDEKYIGIIEEINLEYQKAFVAFTHPSAFKCYVAFENLVVGEIVEQPKKKQRRKRKEPTRLSQEEKEDLRKLYIELALATNDKEWFLELTGGETK